MDRNEKTTLMQAYDLEKRDVKFRYMFLDRLRLDCLYYLGYGARYAQHLWTQDERKQIDLMREVYASLPVPPEWLTPEDIADLEKQMIGRDSDMTTNDKHILDLNWEPAQYRVKVSGKAETMDISSSCYVIFGTVGITVFKYKAGKWRRKTVNYWKELSFQEFIQKFNETEWEDA